jgi:hypothetical protein
MSKLPEKSKQATPTYGITTYAQARSSTPAGAAALTWPEICDELEAKANETRSTAQVDPVEQKKRMASWGPYALKPDTTRANENVDHVSLLALDVDKGDRDAVAARLEEHGWAGFIYESPSSTDDDPRFRVVSPITAPIAPESCREMRLAFAEALGLEPGCGVEQACESSRIYFAGRLAGTPERRVDRVEGAPVDVAALPAPVKAWVAAKPATARAGGKAGASSRGARVIGVMYPHYTIDRHELVRGLGGWLASQGWPDAEIVSVVEALPSDQVPERVKQVLEATRDFRAGKPVMGWKVLSERLGNDDAKRLEKAAQSPVFATWRAAQRGANDTGEDAAAKLEREARGAQKPAGKVLDSHGGELASWDEDDEPIEYTCQGLRIAPSDGKITIVGGLPGSGKGPLVDYLAVCIALGKPVLGRFACAQSKVLLLDAEGMRLTKRRARRLARALGHDPRELRGRIELRNVSKLDVDSTQFLDWLKSKIEDGFRVIVLDSYTSAMMSQETEANSIQFADLAKTLGSLGVTVIVIAHARKPPGGVKNEPMTLADIAGSGALGAMAATGIAVSKPDRDNSNLIHVECLRAPEEDFEAFDVEFSDTDGGRGLALEIITKAEARRDERNERLETLANRAGKVIAYLRGASVPQTVRAIADHSGVHNRDLKVVLPALREAGVLRFEPAVRGNGLYDLADPVDGPKGVVFTAEDKCAAAPKPEPDGRRAGGLRR